MAGCLLLYQSVDGALTLNYVEGTDGLVQASSSRAAPGWDHIVTARDRVMAPA